MAFTSKPALAQARRAALYLRVSTGRQAANDVSIPSQRNLTTKFCDSQGWDVTAEFIEPGASATDDRRPVFQRMLEEARSADRRFNVIVVHAYSRFFRDGATMELTIRSLRKLGVDVVSMTQPTGDDPSQQLMRQIVGLFDEYTSRENGKNVTRSMIESARQGFWNGSTPPLGYKIVAAEQRGAKTKKRLAIDPVDAELVRQIFTLYVQGDGATGPLGVKGVTKWLNAHGYRTRKGATFGVGPVYGILTNRSYAYGKYLYGVRSSRTGELHDPANVVEVEIPTILPEALFERVQAKLGRHNPKVTPPRVVNGPILLTGLAVCATCGAGMTRTGTKRGARSYTYYSCAGCHQKGPSVCKGRHVPLAKLDQLVLDNVKAQLLAPERLNVILGALIERNAAKDHAVAERRRSLESDLGHKKDRLSRLYRAIEDGVVEMDADLRDRIQALKAERDLAQATLDRIKSQVEAKAGVTPERIEAFSKLMREKLDEGDIQARKAYLRSVVSRIEVDDQCVRLIGEKADLADVIAGRQTGAGNVRGFVRSWRARNDSNVRPSDS